MSCFAVDKVDMEIPKGYTLRTLKTGDLIQIKQRVKDDSRHDPNAWMDVWRDCVCHSVGYSDIIVTMDDGSGSVMIPRTEPKHWRFR